VRRTLVIVAEVNLPRPTAHLTVLDISLDGSAGRIDTDRDGLTAVGATHLDLGVPGLHLSRLKWELTVFRA
jgi:hypothetical protein